MGKVYDALQRAEVERSRHRGEAPGAQVALQADPAPAKRPKPSRWRRWFGALASRSASAEDAGALNKRRIALLQPDSYVTEQFRTLRTRIDTIAAQRPIRTIAVTSADQGDGKSMTALNLALVMSLGVGNRVALVDCDLRNPRLDQSLGLRVDAGIVEVLRGEAGLDEALLPVDGTSLSVLPVRSLPPNPSELLASAAMRELVEKLATKFDRVVFDLPPTLGLPDSSVVSELCDGILFVLRATHTPRRDAEEALAVLDRERLLGVVLNDVEMEPNLPGYRD